MSPTRVLLLAGGRSGEHEVSITSARSLLAAVGSGPLHFELAVLDRRGHLLGPEASQAALARGHADDGGVPLLQAAAALGRADVVFPLLHGPYGEDGTVQGLLEMVGVPYVGAGVLASALCMDKVMTKEVLRASGLPQTPYALVQRDAHRRDPAATAARLRALRPPWFVKPANLGSSVGIAKVADVAGLDEALGRALALDRRAIVEQGVPQARELEVGILGTGAAAASPVGEITYDADFYDYATKYTAGRARMHVPAPVPAAISAEVQRLALQAFALVDGAGLARIDFFYTEATGVLLNEINTMPGFTPLSMYPAMWEAGGVPYAELVQRLVALALQPR